MIQIILISLIGAVVVHDSSAVLAHTTAWSWGVLTWYLGAMCSIAVVVHIFTVWCGRQLDRTGEWRHVRDAERVLWLSRLGAAGVHWWGVLSLGWLDAVRGLVGGDWPAVDELLCLAPALGVLASGWASYWEIDRRLREASFIGTLDTGAPARTLPTRAQFVADQFRHHVLVILLPMTAIGLWSESVEIVERAAAAEWEWLTRSALAGRVVTAVHFAGPVIVLALMPWGLRHVWRTSRLGEGPIRVRLQRLCERQRVKCRDFLVWHSHTGMVNGALVGLLPGMRYILLTDALLERLSETEVEAVMAHEVGHAARRHIPWMGAGVLVSVLGTELLIRRLVPGEWGGGGSGLGDAAAGVSFGMSLLVGMLVFGWISRRFERQADAFAAQHLSGWSVRRGEPTPAPLISPEAAEAMAGALSHVSRLTNHPEDQFTFRHGSIAGRRRGVLALTGAPADNLAVDRTVRRIKLATLIAVICVLVMSVLTA